MSDKPNSESPRIADQKEPDVRVYINSKGQAVCKACNFEMEWLWDLLQCPKCKLTLPVEAYYRFLEAYGTPELRYPV